MNPFGQGKGYKESKELYTTWPLLIRIYREDKNNGVLQTREKLKNIPLSRDEVK